MKHIHFILLFAMIASGIVSGVISYNLGYNNHSEIDEATGVTYKEVYAIRDSQLSALDYAVCELHEIDSIAYNKLKNTKHGKVYKEIGYCDNAFNLY